jgi:transketolase
MNEIPEKKSTREGFAKAILENALDQRLWVISADLSESLMMNKFAEKANERFVECGIAEQNAVTVSAGICMQNEKNIAFFGSFAEFLPYRCLDQIRISVCMQNLNVKLVASHAGLSYGADGESIQALEDIAIMRALPNMKVYVPSSANEAYKMTLQMLSEIGPTYMRLNREPDPELFEISANSSNFNGVVKKGKDILIISCGHMLSISLEVAEILEKKYNISVTVYNCSVIKPLLEHELLSLIETHSSIVTTEEHQLIGGLGSAISELVCTNSPKKITMIGINDKFGQSGSVEELRKFYKLDIESVVQKIENSLKL